MSSILGSSSSNGNMGSSPFFHEFKKQASFFLKEKIKTARLVLTDVTSAQLLTEEATNGNPGVPDSRSLKMISKAAFEIDDYWRIVDILHRRLMSFDRKNWRVSYKALIVLEHLLTHGPERVAEEFQVDRDGIKATGELQYIDEKGFNWGLQVRRKSEKILELLENRALLKEERHRARSVTRGIQGFGSFSDRSSSSDHHVVLQEIGSASSLKSFGKCNSQFHEHGNEEENNTLFDDRYDTKGKLDEKQENNSENSVSLHKLYEEGKLGNESSRISFKENRIPVVEVQAWGLDDKWDTADESNTLLSNNQKDVGNTGFMTHAISFEDDDDHPFNLGEQLNNNVSLLSTNDRVLRAF